MLFIGMAPTLLLSGCGRVQIKNHEWCADIGTQGATCAETLSTDTRDIPKEQWDNERFGQLCTTVDTFTDIKAVIEKLCSVSGRCDYETKQKIRAFFERTDVLVTKIPGAKP